MIPLTARLENDPVELERLDCIVPAATRKQRNVAIYFNAVLAILYAVFGFVRLGRRGHDLGMGYVWLGLAIAYLALAGSALYRKHQYLAARTTDSNVTISDAVLTFTPSDRALGWGKLQSIVDAGGYFVFLDAWKNRHAAIAKSRLPSEGRVLWRELDDLLVSKRYLIRSTLSHERIVIDKPRRERVIGA